MTTYYVSTSGSNGNSGTSSGTAWRNIEYAVHNANVDPGDIIKVLPGTYAENIYWWDSTGGREGSAGLPITLEANDLNNRPIISGPETYPGDGSPFQLEIKNLSHIIVNGFTFYDFWQCGGLRVLATTSNQSDITIQNCHFEQGGYTTWTTGNNPDKHIVHVVTINSQSTFFSITRAAILGCTFKNVQTGLPNGFNETCTFQGYIFDSVMQDNNIDHGTFIAFDVIGAWISTGSHYGYPQRTVVRNNVVKNMVADANGGKNGIYVDRHKSSLLIEQNRLIGVGKGIHVGCETYWNYNFGNGEKVIVRNNVVDGTASMVDGVGANGFGQTEYIDSYNYYDRVAVSHNIFYTTGGDVVPYRCTSARNAKTKNNVIRSEGSSPYMVLDGLYTHLYETGRLFDGNMFSGAADRYYPVYDQHYTGHAAFQAGGWNTNGQVGTPVYTNRASEYFYDWRLTAASPGYGDAVALTTATNSGINKKSLIVSDPYYFYDGWGIYYYRRTDAGATELVSEGGDTIVVNGQVAVIESVNYSTGAIALDRSVTWAAGDEIYYAYETSPSVGVTLPVATVSGDIPTPPTPEPTPDPDTVVNTNDTFTSDLTSWSFYSTAGNYTASASAGVVTIAGSLAGSFTQLMQAGLTLISGGTYTVLITAWADRTAIFDLDVILNISPYSTYASQPVVLGQSSSTFSYTFVATGSTSDARLRISIPNSPSGDMTVSIDRFALIYGDSGSVVEIPVADSNTPVDVAAHEGDDVLFAAVFTGTSPTYQWYDSGGAVSDGGDISGATTSTLSIQNVQLAEDGDTYYCTATNSAGSDDSRTATLSVSEVVAGASDVVSQYLQVSAADHDVYVTTMNANFYVNDTVNYFGDVSVGAYDEQVASLFELTSAIPEGAVITSCTIEINANGSSAGAMTFNILLEDSDDAAVWTNAADCLGRSLTSSVAWSPTLTTSYAWYESVDISSLVQELIDSYGGLAVGALVGVRLQPPTAGWTGTSSYARLTSYNGTPSLSMKLNIEWQETPAATVSDAGITSVLFSRTLYPGSAESDSVAHVFYVTGVLILEPGSAASDTDADIDYAYISTPIPVFISGRGSQIELSPRDFTLEL